MYIPYSKGQGPSVRSSSFRVSPRSEGFPEIIPDGLPRIPPKWGIDFSKDLSANTKLISYLLTEWLWQVKRT